MEKANEIISIQFFNIQNEYLLILKWEISLKEFSLKLINEYWIKSNLARNRLNNILI